MDVSAQSEAKLLEFLSNNQIIAWKLTKVFKVMNIFSIFDVNWKLD